MKNKEHIKKISRVVVSILFTSIFSLLLRHLMWKYFGVDILRIDINPIESIIAVSSINTFRMCVRFYLEHYTGDIMLTMNIPDLLNTPSPEPRPRAEANLGDNLPGAPQGNANPPGNANPGGDPPGNAGAGPQGNVNPEDGFTRNPNGVYMIVDPTNVANRGYLNPATGRPYPSSQPYARHLSNAMEDLWIKERHNQFGNVQKFGEGGWRFYSEYMGFHHPERRENDWWNSVAVRKGIKNLP